MTPPNGVKSAREAGDWERSREGRAYPHKLRRRQSAEVWSPASPSLSCPLPSPSRYSRHSQADTHSAGNTRELHTRRARVGWRGVRGRVKRGAGVVAYHVGVLVVGRGGGGGALEECP